MSKTYFENPLPYWGAIWESSPEDLLGPIVALLCFDFPSSQSVPSSQVVKAILSSPQGPSVTTHLPASGELSLARNRKSKKVTAWAFFLLSLILFVSAGVVYVDSLASPNVGFDIMAGVFILLGIVFIVVSLVLAGSSASTRELLICSFSGCQVRESDLQILPLLSGLVLTIPLEPPASIRHDCTGCGGRGGWEQEYTVRRNITQAGSGAPDNWTGGSDYSYNDTMTRYVTCSRCNGTGVGYVEDNSSEVNRYRDALPLMNSLRSELITSGKTSFIDRTVIPEINRRIRAWNNYVNGVKALIR